MCVVGYQCKWQTVDAFRKTIMDSLQLGRTRMDREEGESKQDRAVEQSKRNPVQIQRPAQPAAVGKTSGGGGGDGSGVGDGQLPPPLIGDADAVAAKSSTSTVTPVISMVVAEERVKSIETMLDIQGDVLHLSGKDADLVVVDPQWFAQVYIKQHKFLLYYC